MKNLSYLILASSLLLGTTHAAGLDMNVGPFSLEFGTDDNEGNYSNRPQRNFQQNEGDEDQASVDHHSPNVDNPICYAISQQKQLQMVVIRKEVLNSKEARITTRNVTVEPYLFGLSNDRQPILRGNIVKDKLLREVTIKYGEDQFDDKGQPLNRDNQTNRNRNYASNGDRKGGNNNNPSNADDQNYNNNSEDQDGNERRGYFSGWFKSDKDSSNSIDLRKIRNLKVVENSHFDIPKDYSAPNKDVAQVICQIPAPSKK